jgi:SAM-dependent methyltransferase
LANEAMQRQWNSPEFLKRWRTVEPSAAAATAPLMEVLDPKPGESLLDVGCGGGLSTLAAAEIVGPTGKLLGADLSEPLLELARERAREASAGHVSFIVADVQVAQLPGGPFDGAFSRFGVMFFADFVEAFGNIRRHLKPGGRFAFVCFQDHAANPWYPAAVLAKYAPPRPPSRFPAPSPYALGDRVRTTGFLDEAGFKRIEFHPFGGEIEAPYDPQASAGQLAPFGLAPDVLAQAQEELREYEMQFVRDGISRTTRQMWAVRAWNDA